MTWRVSVVRDTISIWLQMERSGMIIINMKTQITHLNTDFTPNQMLVISHHTNDTCHVTLSRIFTICFRLVSITNRREAVDIMILHMVIINPIMILHTVIMNLIMTHLMVIMNPATTIMIHHMDIMIYPTVILPSMVKETNFILDLELMT